MTYFHELEHRFRKNLKKLTPALNNRPPPEHREKINTPAFILGNMVFSYNDTFKLIKIESLL